MCYRPLGSSLGCFNESLLCASPSVPRQVCNLVWSRNANEIASTHGYSHNQIVVWKYPSMSKVWRSANSVRLVVRVEWPVHLTHCAGRE